MTEDPRIREIRAVLDEADQSGACEGDGAYLGSQLDRIREILDSAPPAPRVWFPGDSVPAGTPVVNHVGGIWRHHADRAVKTGYALEIFLPSPEERDHAASRARQATSERAAGQHTEGTNP